MINEQFEAQLMQAVVRQFFENPSIFGTLPDGTPINIPSRPTPAQAVVAGLLSNKQGELLDAIMDAIDIDVMAQKVADEVLKVLTAPESRNPYYSDPATETRKRLKERVDNRLVELMAQNLYARLNDVSRDVVGD